MDKKGIRLTKDLVIAALAMRCPNRKHTGPYYYICDSGDGHPTNCNPRLCMHTISFFDDIRDIANGVKDSTL